MPTTFAAPDKRVRTEPVGKPRLGLAGAGWIGRNRVGALLAEDRADLVAIAEPDVEAARSAGAMAKNADLYEHFDTLLARSDLDGLVIATPSALHARQAEAALERGVAVFCEKPLGRTAQETRRVVETARRADKLLGVDLSYRFTDGMQRIRQLVRDGAIGEIYAVHLNFHNAYGPGSSWFYDPTLSGGGCVIDLGTHLIDMALWTLDFPDVTSVASRLLAKGRPLTLIDGAEETSVEDYASIRLDLSDDVTVTLGCSWNLPAGRDATIEASFYGTEGGLSFRNVDGSYYDFIAERYDGRTRTTLCEPPDEWSGGAISRWAEMLARGAGFEPEVATVVQVASVLDAIYDQ